VLRAPFVAAVTWLRGDFVAVYRVGTLVCLLAGTLLSLPAVSAMLRRGQRPVIVLVVLSAIVLGPATFGAVMWGHPEELLGAGLAVAAVVAAIHRRGVVAGVLLGLAVATKQWGLFAVLPTLMLARGQRRQVASAAVIVAGVFVLGYVPLAAPCGSSLLRRARLAKTFVTRRRAPPTERLPRSAPLTARPLARQLRASNPLFRSDSVGFGRNKTAAKRRFRLAPLSVF
jgi:hypothetical protein